MEFKKGQWTNEVNVRDFIVENYCPYDGDDSFLTPPTDSTVLPLGQRENFNGRRTQKRRCSFH